MEQAQFDEALGRLLQAAGVENPNQLADILGISSQAVYVAIKKKRIPDGWYTKLSEKRPNFDISLVKAGAEKASPSREDAGTGNLLHELETEKNERRVLMSSFMKLSDENQRLWAENVALREKMATLEARLRDGGTNLS